MNQLTLAQVLPSVQFATTSNGQRVVILGADEWEKLIEWLEDIEDSHIIQNALKRLRAGPEASGAIPLEEVLDEL
jgi:PHD/YefM family antitoxin component YafN of YafNO toxin-antitoxin module